jgi:hypothetical protein
MRVRMRQSRMLTSVFLIGLLCSGVFAFGETATATIVVQEYVERFLDHSVDLDAARETAESALEAYENAKLSQQSAYALGLLESDSIFRGAELGTTENATVRLAFQRIFTAVAASTSLSFVQSSEEIAATAYTRNEELAKKEYVSVRDTLLARMAFFQSSIHTRNAENAEIAAQKALIRPIRADYARLEIKQFDLSIDVPGVPELARVLDNDATIHKHRTNLTLYTERRSFLESSEVFSPAELDAIVQTITQTELQLQQRIWSLQDNVDLLRSQIEANKDALTIAKIDSEVESMDLEQAKHQFENGDIYASEVTQAELNLAIAQEQLAALERNRFLLVLDVIALSGVSLRGWIAETFGE